METRDKEIASEENAEMSIGRLEWLIGEQQIIDFGAIVICRRGEANVHIGFNWWHLSENITFVLFPEDAVALRNVSEDFEVEMLKFSSAMMREASLQLEQTVYHDLRNDRFCADKEMPARIVNSIFSLLRIYFEDKECACLHQLTVYQLKAFFLGFNDWIRRYRLTHIPDSGSRRVNEIFNSFMNLIEADYKQSHDVAYYAARLNITPKYLTTICRTVCGHTPKTLIDHYVILQIKQQLRSSDISIKQLAWEFNFSDVSFFCRYVRRLTGKSPRDNRMKIEGQG